MKSDGERLFAAYLRQCRLEWQYEPDIGGRRPDFLVEHPVRSFVAEVYEPEIHLPPGGGSFESYSARRGAFEGRRSKQLARLSVPVCPTLPLPLSPRRTATSVSSRWWWPARCSGTSLSR